MLYAMLCDMRSFDHRPVSFTVAEFVHSLILLLSLSSPVALWLHHESRATNALAVCKQIQLVFESHAHHTHSIVILEAVN